MTTLTITQRIQEGDSVLERTASLETDSPSFSVPVAGEKLIHMLHNAMWTSPEQPSLPSPVVK